MAVHELACTRHPQSAARIAKSSWCLNAEAQSHLQLRVVHARLLLRVVDGEEVLHQPRHGVP